MKTRQPLEVPRDRNSSFDPQNVPKGQTHFDGFDDKILSLYARGMTTREVQSHLEEIYQVEISPALISSVTEAVIEEVKVWQNRPLDALCPILYLDALRVKIRDGAHIRNKAIYLAIGVNLAGIKEVLGLWVAQTVGAKFWLQIVTELKNLGRLGYFHRVRRRPRSRRRAAAARHREAPQQPRTWSCPGEGLRPSEDVKRCPGEQRDEVWYVCRAQICPCLHNCRYGTVAHFIPRRNT
jgi:hypothetical protein